MKAMTTTMMVMMMIVSVMNRSLEKDEEKKEEAEEECKKPEAVYTTEYNHTLLTNHNALRLIVKHSSQYTDK